MIEKKRKAADNPNDKNQNISVVSDAVIEQYAQKYTCDGCKADITKVVKICCAECPTLDFCVECFSKGVEPSETSHKREHPYRIMEILDYSIYEEGWGVDEELLLNEGLDLFGMGNWEQIADHIKTKTKAEVAKHYIDIYCKSSSWPLPVEVPPFDKDSTRRGFRETNDQRKTVIKQKPVSSAPTNHEISGYMPGRREFDTEYENDAELHIKELGFDEGDSPEETELKLTMLEIYNSVLDKRELRKAFILERDLVDFKKIQANEKRRTPKERELYHQARVFAKMQSGLDFDMFMDGLMSEIKLRNRIAELQEYRKMGLTTFHEVEEYEKDKKLKVTNPPSKGFFASTSMYRPSRFRIDESPTSTTVPRTPQSISGTSSAEAARRSQIPPPVDISNSEGFELLAPSEQQICSTLRILPRAYIVIKETILREYTLRNGNLRKRQARGLVKIDVNKTGKLYDFWVNMGWIAPPGLAGDA
ncbi:Transcriptional adapter ada2 [Nowakowskiella sp. JEL0078]|nr:Transcriptional adapter ada2 [Nowakowskiella sp. JEL0078]